LPHHPPADEVVISMRPVSVFANGSGSEIERLEANLRGRWREATRAVILLPSLHGLPAVQIAVLLDSHHPATVRRGARTVSSRPPSSAHARDRRRPARGHGAAPV
jgi:hypothetical protein